MKIHTLQSDTKKLNKQPNEKQLPWEPPQCSPPNEWQFSNLFPTFRNTIKIYFAKYTV